MIYLIGGAPRVGKTTLAKIILERNRIPYIPTDIIRGALYKYLNKELDSWLDRPEFFFVYLKDFMSRANAAYPDGCVIEGDIFLPSQIADLKKDWIKCIFLGASDITLEQIKIHDPASWVSKLGVEQQMIIPNRVKKISEIFKMEAVQHGFAYFDIYPDRNAVMEDAYQCLIGNPE